MASHFNSLGLSRMADITQQRSGHEASGLLPPFLSEAYPLDKSGRVSPMKSGRESPSKGFGSTTPRLDDERSYPYSLSDLTSMARIREPGMQPDAFPQSTIPKMM